MSSKELKATWGLREALVKVMEGKKLRRWQKKTQKMVEKNSANSINIPQVKIHKSQKKTQEKQKKTQEMAEKNSENSKMTHKLGIKTQKTGEKTQEMADENSENVQKRENIEALYERLIMAFEQFFSRMYPVIKYKLIVWSSKIQIHNFYAYLICVTIFCLSAMILPQKGH